MKRGDCFEDGDEGGEDDEHGDEDVHEYSCGGRVGPLEEVVEVRTPGRLDDRSARRVRRIVVLEGVAAGA